MTPSGWPGFKKIYEPGPNGAVYRISNEKFEETYELPESSLFKKFINGIRREDNR